MSSKYSAASKKRYASKSKRYIKSKIPRAIQTRGTPAGYYEIPVTSLTRVFYTTDSGFWNTDQINGTVTGTVGWNGFCWTTTLSDTIMSFGNGSNVFTITQAVPGYSGPQNSFDLVKISHVSMEIQFVNSMHDATVNNTGGVYLSCAYDPNDRDPPATESAILQYSNLKTLTNGNIKTIKLEFTPAINEVIADSNNNGSVSGYQTSQYVNTAANGVSHRGVIGWLSNFANSGTNYKGYVMFKITQTRRYKLNK